MEQSEEVIAFLAVADYQEFILLLTAAASSKDIIQADVMFVGLVSDIIEEIKTKTDDQVKKEADRAKAQAGNKPQEVQDLTKKIQDIVTELTTLKKNLVQKKSTLLNASSFYATPRSQPKAQGVVHTVKTTCYHVENASYG